MTTRLLWYYLCMRSTWSLTTTPVRDFESVVQKAACCEDKEVRFGGSRWPGRFELFAMRTSICSQKVRTALMVDDVAFVEHQIIPFGNYDPAYARLRQLAAPRWTDASWDGTSSAENHGVDPLVVPTLVDLEERRVVVDSKAILHYLDGVVGKKARAFVRRHVDLVDEFPHPILLYKAPPDIEDPRPACVRNVMATYGSRMLTTLRTRIEEVPSDLRPLYALKLKKAEATWKDKDDAALFHASLARGRRILEHLYADLQQNGVDLLRSPKTDAPTAGDIAWLVTLARITELGYGKLLLDDLDVVQRYFHRLLNHPRLRDAFVYGHLPSPYLTPLLRDHAGPLAVQDNVARIRAWETTLKEAAAS